jgi:tetratricopeptide (TPR) repeat protein
MASADLARARTLIDLRRYAEAESTLRALLAQEPEDAEVVRLLADVVGDLGRYDEQEQLARRAVALEPDAVWGHQVLADALVHKLDQAGAVAAAQRCVELDPSSWISHYTLARALRVGRLPRTRDALDAANVAVSLAPHSADAHNLAGVCLSDLNLDAEARRAYANALRIDPAHHLALNNLAALDADSGRLRSAVTALRTGLSHAPQVALLHDNYDVILLKLIRRLWWALLGLGIVLLVLAATGAPYLSRLATAACLLGIYTALTLRVTRELPRGAHLWARGLLGRVGVAAKVMVLTFLLLSAAVVGMGVAPRAAAEAIGIGTLSVLRFAGLGMLVLGAFNLIFRRSGGHD